MKTTLIVSLFALLVAPAGKSLAQCSGEPFQHSAAPGAGVPVIIMNSGIGYGNSSFSVPAGKRLVIEHVSMLVFVPTKSGQSIHAGINTDVGGKKVGHFLGAPVNLGSWPATSATPAFDMLALSQTIRAYADAGTQVGFGASRTGSAAGQVSVYYTVSGRLLGACDD